MCICEIMGSPTQGYWMRLNPTPYILFLEEETASGMRNNLPKGYPVSLWHSYGENESFMITISLYFLIYYERK